MIKGLKGNVPVVVITVPVSSITVVAVPVASGLLIAVPVLSIAVLTASGLM